MKLVATIDVPPWDHGYVTSLENQGDIVGLMDYAENSHGDYDVVVQR